MIANVRLLAGRLDKIAPSATVGINSLALKMKAAGEDVMILAAGEPDFETPDHIKQAAIDAIWRGETRYTNVDGTMPLKQAVAAKFKRANGLDYDVAQITVSAGGKQVISNALIATINAGDEVVIPAPYWVSYPDLVSLCEGVPVIVPTQAVNGYKMTAQELDRAITPKTKWLILNSPSNPTGAVYSQDELKALGEVLLRHPHVFVMTDDIYEPIVYDGLVFTTIAQVVPELYERTLVVNGVSKAYNMTGWRIGYGAGPQSLIKAMAGIQSHLTACPCSISQAASLAALTGPQDFIARQRDVFCARRDKIVADLNAIEGIECPLPQGAFYVYPSCGALIGKQTPQGKVLQNDQDVVTYFLEAKKVALVHGAAFGMSPCFRISYAAAQEVLDEACRRIAQAVADLRA